VITLCSSATGVACPACLGPALRAHWGVDDPATADGIDAAIAAKFEDAYRVVRKRIEALVALPHSALLCDRLRLKAEFDRIGTLS